MTRGDAPTAAVAWATSGRTVLPVWPVEADGRCACGKSACLGPGKHLLTALIPHGVRDATADPMTVQQWYALWPDANVGLVLGDGLIALDIGPGLAVTRHASPDR